MEQIYVTVVIIVLMLTSGCIASMDNGDYAFLNPDGEIAFITSPMTNGQIIKTIVDGSVDGLMYDNVYFIEYNGTWNDSMNESWDNRWEPENDDRV